MRKYFGLFLLLLLCIVSFVGCTGNQEKAITTVEKQTITAVKADYPAAIMVEGTLYYMSIEPMPAEIDESAIVGYTTSYSDTMPEQDGETNFNRELGMAYARVRDGIAVLYENEWYLCTPKS